MGIVIIQIRWCESMTRGIRNRLDPQPINDAKMFEKSVGSRGSIESRFVSLLRKHNGVSNVHKSSIGWRKSFPNISSWFDHIRTNRHQKRHEISLNSRSENPTENLTGMIRVWRSKSSLWELAGDENALDRPYECCHHVEITNDNRTPVRFMLNA